jgi:hypothetical protein
MFTLRAGITIHKLHDRRSHITTPTKCSTNQRHVPGVFQLRCTFSAVCPRSGSDILMILTSEVWVTLLIDCGVMKMNCRPIERRAAWMIMCKLLSRLTLSMKTSLGQSAGAEKGRRWRTYNSSRQRMGEPIASHNESRRHTVEYDFSPPESVLVCLPSPLRSMISG